MIPRVLEPEVMDTAEEARDYDAMDHAEVNRAFVDDFLAAAEASAFADRLHSASHPLDVLDVGTGTALIPIELCSRPVCCRITAVDLSREMLKVAAINIARAGLEMRIALEHVDGKLLAYADRSWPAVISNSIVHHIPEPRAVFAEMVRVVKPGGCLFVRDLLRPPSIQKVDELVSMYAGDANPHQRQMFRNSLCAALTLDEVREILAERGLPAGWVRQTTDRHWTLAGIFGVD